MRAVLGLATALLRGAGRRAALSSVLAATAVAVATALLVLTVAANQGFDARADREAWRIPQAVDADEATAVLALTTDSVRDEPLVEVDVAALSADAPVPPGLPRFPAPGEVWLSPALAERVAALPDDELADRLAGTVVGEVGRAGLVHPDELLSVTGRAPDDPAMARDADVHPLRGDDEVLPTPIAGYAGGPVTQRAEVYGVLSAMASVLLVVPLLVLSAAGGRLMTAQRDRRLAALRLVGATPAQVLALTTVETVLVGAIGAVAGVVVGLVATPAAARVEMGGGPWFTADLWLDPVWLAGLLVGVPLLVGASALVGMRRLVVSPLGVARRETPPRLRAVRVLVFVVVLVAYGAVAGRNRSATAMNVAAVAAMIGSLTLVGPWVVAVLGRVLAAGARRPAGLLAARRLVDDPRAAWRAVGGIVLAGFVAGFVVALAPSVTGVAAQDAAQLTLPLPADGGDAAPAEAAERLASAGVAAEVSVGDAPPGHVGEVVLVVAVDGGPAAVDRARTALSGLVPGAAPLSAADLERQGRTTTQDIVTGAIAVLTASLVVAVSSSAITGAATVLDRRATFAALRLAGTPLRVLDAARTRETLLPLAVLGGGAMLAGIVCAAPFAVGGGAPAPPAGFAPLAVCAVLAVAGALGASRATRPLLRRVTADLAVARE